MIPLWLLPSLSSQSDTRVDVVHRLPEWLCLFTFLPAYFCFALNWRHVLGIAYF